MSPNFPASNNGSTNDTLRVTTDASGHVVTVQVTYTATPTALCALIKARNHEIWDATSASQAPNADAQWFRKLLATHADFTGQVQAQRCKVRLIVAELRAIAKDGKPNVEARQAHLFRRLQEEGPALKIVESEMELLISLLETAGSAAKRESVEREKLRKMATTTVLENARLALTQEIVAALAPRLTRLLALDAAIAVTRPQSDSSQIAQKPAPKLEPVGFGQHSADPDDDNDDGESTPVAFAATELEEPV